MEKDLGRDDWLKAARLALLRGGVEAVRVEKLARALRVTKGSFYWHFKDREELLDLLLREWEGEAAEIALHLGKCSSREKTMKLLQLLAERARLSEQGDVPSDAAIFAWASTSPEVARRVNRCELERIRLLDTVGGQPEWSEIFYLVWLGFVARGQRVPAFRKRFPFIARTMLDLLLPPKTKPRKAGPAVRKPVHSQKTR
jgi:AcrR family transcriptional regulator